VAADYQAMVRNLLEFHPFSGRRVISVGAGGGQFIEYAREAGRVIAVDCDPDAASALERRVREAGLEDKFSIRVSDFLMFAETADTALFEFSLHEMADPAGALGHALELAAEVVILDHYPDSPWVYFVAEEGKVRAAWDAVARLRPSRRRIMEAVQSFHDFQELEDKVRSQGWPALSRVAAFRGQVEFTIPMVYALAEVRR
jgi:predicted RNA methylase